MFLLSRKRKKHLFPIPWVKGEMCAWAYKLVISIHVFEIFKTDSHFVTYQTYS